MQTKTTATLAPLLVLFLAACSGSSTERSQTDAGTSSTAPAPSSTVTTPVASQPPAPGPNLTYGQLDTTLDGEVPIRWNPVFSGAPRTRLEGGVLWAPARDVVRVLSPQAKVAFQGGQLQVDGKPVSARARSESGEVWVEVVPLARHFGALGRVNPQDSSVVIFPRETLLWLRDHGDPNAPAVREAREAGLLDG